MNKESSATNIDVVKTLGMRTSPSFIPSYISILRLSSKQSPAGESRSWIQSLKLNIKGTLSSFNTFITHRYKNLVKVSIILFITLC
jgi:primosomal replication protein N